MDDISDATSVATSTPEDAANNISNANLFGVDPRYAAQNKSIFDDKASALSKPQQAEPPVADYMRQSSEHTALATPDVDHLSWMAKQTKMISDYVFDRPTTEQNIIDLNLKKMNNGGKLEGDDELALMSANQDAADQSQRNYGLNGPLNQIPAHIAGFISETGQSIVRGARKGLFESGLPLIGSHPVETAIAAVAYGAMVKDPYDTLSAGTYNELSKMTDANGQPKNLDEDTKLAYARGVGVIGTALMNTAGLLVAEGAPFLKPLMNPVLASGLINTPAKAAVMIGLGNAIKGSAAMAGASGLTEVAKIVAEEMGKNHGGDEAGFWNSLTKAMTKANASRVGSAAASGAATGAAMELPIQLLGFNSTRRAFQDRLDFEMANRTPPGASRDVTPEAQKALPGAQAPTTDSVIDLTPTEGGGGGANEQAYKVLQLNEALHNINDVQKSTNMNGVAPTELNEVNKQSFEAAGMNKFYTTKEALNEWIGSQGIGGGPEGKQKAISRFIDPKGRLAGQLNAPIELQAHDMMQIAKDYPDILDHIQYSPDTPNAISAKEHIEALQRGEQQRTDLMAKLGIKPEEVKPESNVKQLTPESKPTAAPKYFLADVKRTQEILDENKAKQTEIDNHQKRIDAYEQVKKDGGNVLDIKKAKDEIERNDFRKEMVESFQDSIDKNNKELEKIKGRVTDALKESPPGSILAFPYDEKAAAIKAELKYGYAPTFGEAIQKVLPPEAAAKYNASQLKARMNYADLVHDAAVHEMNKVVDQSIAMGQEEARRSELERIAHDPNYAIVDKFHMHQIANAKGKAKHSIYAVDPSTLPDELLHYADNPQLKSHKVFVKGANDLETSSQALGFNSSKDMLEVMSKTPTREQIVKARAKFYDSEIENMVREGVDLDHTNIMKAFTERTRAHLEEMKFMKDQEWPSTKFGIKTIALPLPRAEDIEHDSRETVKQLKVGSLSVSQYKVGERQSQRIAVHAILNNEVEKAFQAKEMAARNASIQKEVLKAIADINRAQKFFQKLDEPNAIEIMRTAGKSAINALDEITDVFNFNPKRKGQSEQNSFNKWARREVEAGRGDFSIPERLSDIRKSIDDMTVEQVRVAYDRAKTIFKEAGYKSQLIKIQDVRSQERSIERIVDQVEKNLADHPGNEQPNIVNGNALPPKILKVQPPSEMFKAIHLKLQSVEMVFTNMENIIRYYDQGKTDGFFQKTFMHPIKGDGEYFEKTGTSKKSAMLRSTANKIREIKDVHGGIDKIEKKSITIPEFKDFKDLNFGQLTKADLMTAWANKGDPENREYLQKNYKDSNGKGLSLETLTKVLDRELTTEDVVATQQLVDMYKNYQDETRDMQHRRKGEDVTFVKGVGNEHRGTIYPGGYLPGRFQNEFTDIMAKKTAESIEGKNASWFEGKDGAFYGRQHAAETTEQGRLIQRVGNNLPLDLSFLGMLRGNEEIIHDLSYGEVVPNNLKLLRQPEIKAALIKAGGEGRYNTLIDGHIEIAGRIAEQNMNIFGDQNNFIKRMNAGFATKFNIMNLVGNLGVVAVQYEELTQLLQNSGGLNGAKHMGAVVRELTTHPHLWGAYYEFAKHIDPTIANASARVQNSVGSTIYDLAPIKGESLAQAATKFIMHKGMAPSAFADVTDKVIGALMRSRQFLAGDVENWPIEKVMALSPEERQKAMQASVAQLNRLSLMNSEPEDKAIFQKNPATQYFGYYWNYFRNVFNNRINTTRKINSGIRDTVSHLRKGFGEEGSSEDFKSAGKSFGSTASLIAFTTLIAALGRMYAAKLHGEDTPDKWGMNLKTKEGMLDAAKRMGEYATTSPIEEFVSSMPFARDILHAANKPDRIIRGFVDKRKDVNLPVTTMMGDLATGINALHDSYDQANSISEFLHNVSNLDNTQTKALLNDSAYIGIPWPTNAYSKIMRALQLPLNSPAQVGPTVYEKLHSAIAEYKLNPNKELSSPQFNAQLDHLEMQTAPKAISIPDGMTDTMKYAMSGANWASPEGIYGFSKEQWNQVKSAAPDLGLTESGRTAKNIEQQEKAMDYFLHDAAQKLTAKDVRVDKASLYGAFKLGVDKYEAVYKAPNDTKVKTILSAEDLAKNPDFLQYKTVGQLKTYLSNQAAEASKHAKGPELTSSNDKAED